MTYEGNCCTHASLVLRSIWLCSATKSTGPIPTYGRDKWSVACLVKFAVSDLTVYIFGWKPSNYKNNVKIINTQRTKQERF